MPQPTPQFVLKLLVVIALSAPTTSVCNCVSCDAHGGSLFQSAISFDFFCLQATSEAAKQSNNVSTCDKYMTRDFQQNHLTLCSLFSDCCSLLRALCFLLSALCSRNQCKDESSLNIALLLCVALLRNQFTVQRSNLYAAVLRFPLRHRRC